MAYCHGPNSPYGCGHHKEHIVAAKKGWETRRHGAAFQDLSDEQAIGLLFGGSVEEAHEGQNHKNIIVFKHNGEWYDLPKKEFRRLAGEGRRFQKKLARAQKRVEQEEARDEVRYLREVARAKAAGERETLRKAREAERNQKKAERERAREEKRVIAARSAQYRDVIKTIRGMGGIRPYERPSGQQHKGKYVELEEWRDLPASVRTYTGFKGKKPFALDDVAQSISYHFPGIGVENGEDLSRFLREEKRRIDRARLLAARSA